jgi:predicted small metal-binding protein
MTKVIHCRDVGFDCDGVIRAQTEEEALQMAAVHAKTVHGLTTISPEVVDKIKSVMTEEPEAEGQAKQSM